MNDLATSTQSIPMPIVIVHIQFKEPEMLPLLKEAMINFAQACVLH